MSPASVPDRREDAAPSADARRLPVVREGELPALSRHPDDGWQLADPYPLGPRARRALRALIVVITPAAPAPQPKDMVDRIEMHMRRHMPYMHWTAALGLWFAVLVLDWLPLLRFRGISRLHTWERGPAAALLREVLVGKNQLMRMMVVGVRGLVLSAYFDQEEVQEAINYRPRPFITDKIREREALLDSAPPSHPEAAE